MGGENTSIENKAEALEQSHQSAGYPVQILHYHRKEILLENLFCIVFGLPTTCTGVSNGTLTGEVYRESRKDLELCRWTL
jgi:hypothetical protein